MNHEGAPPLLDMCIPMTEIAGGALDRAMEQRRSAMQECGVHEGVLVADQRGPSWHPDRTGVEWQSLSSALDSHTDVFAGAIGIDPTTGVEAVRALRAAVDEGCVAAHAVPHTFGLAPDHAAWYPTYASCIELGIPIMVELGVRRSRGTRMRSVGRPICLDTVACDFPDLRLVAIGPWPWMEEAISMAYKHAGIYLAIGGDDPGAGDASVARFAASWGRDKVVFASGGAAIAAAVDRTRDMELDIPALWSLHRTATSLLGGQKRL